jgi:hypothetical protein
MVNVAIDVKTSHWCQYRRPKSNRGIGGLIRRMDFMPDTNNPFHFHFHGGNRACPI